MGAHLGLHLKNERKTKFRQLGVKLLQNFAFFFFFFFLFVNIVAARWSLLRQQIKF